MKDNIKIVNMADYPQFIEEVSKLLWEEWSRHNGKTLEEVTYRTKHCLKKDKIPQIHIAIRSAELLGTVSLWTCDLSKRQDLSPWMACLYVKPEYRGMGIGTSLQKKSVEVAEELKYKKLYLITEHENYYEKMGWKFLEVAPLKGERLTRIYEYKIGKDSA